MKGAIDELKAIDPVAVSGPQADPITVHRYKQLIKDITANFDEFHEETHDPHGNARVNAANKQMPAILGNNNVETAPNTKVNLQNDAFVGYTFDWEKKVGFGSVIIIPVFTWVTFFSQSVQ
jgi:hypothetical protein